MNSVVYVLMAVALIPIGIWARRNAASLVSPHLEQGARVKRGRVIRRGGSACLAVAAGFAGFAIAEFV